MLINGGMSAGRKQEVSGQAVGQVAMLMMPNKRRVNYTADPDPTPLFIVRPPQKPVI